MYLELITWLIMDGTIVHRSDFNKRIQWKLSKERKINYLIALLERLSIPYTFREATKGGLNKLQPYYICLYGNSARDICHYLEGKKIFPEKWRQELSYSQLLIILKAIENTDGHRIYKSSFYWTSTEFSNISLIKDLCDKFRINFNYTEMPNGSGFDNGKLQYKATIGVYS